MNRPNSHSRIDVRGARSAAELLQLAGPDFSFAVEMRPALVRVNDGAEYIEAPAQVVVRVDTQEAISVVGKRYEPAQVQAFVGPLDELLRDGQLQAVSATTFDRGLHRAIELQLPKPIVLPGPNGTEDVLLRRVVWRDTLDGTARLQLADTLMRRWCSNGAAHIIGMQAAAYRHTAKQMLEAANILDGIEASMRRFELVEANAQRLLATSFAAAQMAQVAERLYPADETGEVTSRSEKARVELLRLFGAGTGTFGATAWDALNAATEWATHQRPVRNGQPALARLKSIWLGDSQVQAASKAIIELSGLTVDDDGAIQ
jgi:phage/plasmid-like protein (TIGR03299 family)